MCGGVSNFSRQQLQHPADGVRVDSRRVNVPPDIARAFREAIEASRPALLALDAWAASQPKAVRLAAGRSGQAWKQALAMMEPLITVEANR